MDDNVINVGDYIIAQRQRYTKLHKLKQHGNLMLGQFLVEMDNVIGEKYFDTFQMKNVFGSKKLYTLEKVAQVNSASNLNIETSGKDNRNITADDQSQKLTKEEIEKLISEQLNSNNIIENLINNSATFNSKTEYSQEKYIKKKEKKYFEFIQIKKPTIRILTQMYYRQDPSKTLGLRIDDLSQILIYANIQSDGDYLLYDSGTSGLMPAAIINGIGSQTSGRLIHIHPGNECQKSAFVAMRFPPEQAERCINVNLYSVLRCYYQNKGNYSKNNENQNAEDSVNVSSKCTSTTEHSEDVSPENTERTNENESPKLEETKEQDANKKDDDGEPSQKRIKLDIEPAESEKKDETKEQDSNKEGDDGEPSQKRIKLDIKPAEPEKKKPGWQFENEKACEIMKNKVDSIIIVAKEHPVNIAKELISFLKGGRTIVVFSLLREPLQDLYVYLKTRLDFIYVRLSNNFMRNYQVLPDRTHPHVNMTNGGYILTAYKLTS